MQDIAGAILSGKTFLGIEFGSTRIKAVLINEAHTPIASGGFDWENRLENGIWTYSLDDIRTGLQSCYARLKTNVKETYGVTLTTVGGMGISGMMHGYLPFNAGGELLTPFRTWRNTMTADAAARLTEQFSFNIPQRWSIAHLYQAMLNNEEHVRDITHMTTLAGYLHWQLTGEQVLGVGEASGMFPIDSSTGRFDAIMTASFDRLLATHGLAWSLVDILPRVLSAGEAAGTLTKAGAQLLDPDGDLLPGIPFCPPEGDAGTGMVATDSITPRTGNISAGTSVFLMAVLEHPMSGVYSEIDVVSTPSGNTVAMVHCNNCCGDIDAWVSLFGQFAANAGMSLPKPQLYDLLYESALSGDSDCGGLFACNYLSGEHVTGFEQGRPLFARTPDSAFTLSNFMRTHLFSAVSALHTGMNILFERENITLDRLSGHGGYFKTKRVGQRVMAAALNTPVTVSETAGEGGPWGMAVLAAYRIQKLPGETLTGYLRDRVFSDSASVTETPDPKDVEGFRTYMKRHEAALAVELAAVNALK